MIKIALSSSDPMLFSRMFEVLLVFFSFRKGRLRHHFIVCPFVNVLLLVLLRYNSTLCQVVDDHTSYHPSRTCPSVFNLNAIYQPY